MMAGAYHGRSDSPKRHAYRERVRRSYVVGKQLPYSATPARKAHRQSMHARMNGEAQRVAVPPATSWWLGKSRAELNTLATDPAMIAQMNAREKKPRNPLPEVGY